ncbi:MAG: histidine kinase [Thermoleophilia bacterium]|nr:histidine kinase [Thermoleophilia bacterium]
MSDPGASDERLLDRLRAEQHERRRLAELIHDGPVQHLAALGQMLDAATISLDRGDTAPAREALTRAVAVAREAAADLRDLVAIEPASLHEQGFEAAVRELTERVARRRGVEVLVDTPAAGLLGERARSGLFQIVREALDQAVRRGPPESLAVTLAQTPVGGVQLVITDDAAQERRQAVITGLAERTDELNGTFTYERSGSATTVRIALPPSAAYV